MSAGKINEDWLAMARINCEGSDLSVEDWICIATAASIAEIVNRSVFIGEESGLGGYNGSWLDQEQVDALCDKIDKGV